jgi:16S rRNA (guanine527-N7)-methyltransferase
VSQDLDSLARRFGLPARGRGQLADLLELLDSEAHPPTAVTDPACSLDVHLADSLVALELDEVRRARVVADLGSGAGFPGLALAIALPHARVSLVESSRRKCSFLIRAVEAARLANATVVCERAEAWEAGRDACDLVTARAVGPLALIAEYAAPLLALGGTAVAWKGRRDPAEEAAAAAAASELGLDGPRVSAAVPYPGSRNRHLHRFDKVAQTPARFPRRPGMARKRPLGGPGR